MYVILYLDLRVYVFDSGHPSVGVPPINTIFLFRFAPFKEINYSPQMKRSEAVSSAAVFNKCGAITNYLGLAFMGASSFALKQAEGCSG